MKIRVMPCNLPSNSKRAPFIIMKTQWNMVMINIDAGSLTLRVSFRRAQKESKRTMFTNLRTRGNPISWASNSANQRPRSLRGSHKCLTRSIIPGREALVLCWSKSQGQVAAPEMTRITLQLTNRTTEITPQWKAVSNLDKTDLKLLLNLAHLSFTRDLTQRTITGSRKMKKMKRNPRFKRLILTLQLPIQSMMRKKIRNDPFLNYF